MMDLVMVARAAWPWWVAGPLIGAMVPAPLLVGNRLSGVGRALVGARPGPLFARIGSGESAVVVPRLGAVAGAWAYGARRPRLPH